MRFKYSLLTTFLCSTLICANSVSFANGCDDLVVNVHNNTAYPVLLDYQTIYATPAIHEGMLIAVGQTVKLKKVINVGSENHTTAMLRLTSVNTANQQDYIYATNNLYIHKNYSSSWSQGAIDKQSSYTDTDYKFQIDYSHEQQSICSNDASQAKPSEVTVEISSPVKQERPLPRVLDLFL